MSDQNTSHFAGQTVDLRAYINSDVDTEVVGDTDDGLPMYGVFLDDVTLTVVPKSHEVTEIFSNEDGEIIDEV